MLRHLALLTLAASTIGAAITGASDPADGAPRAERIELACGGYDASGAVINREAVEIGTFEALAHRPVEVPDVCGGYTADGRFIGDD